MSSNFDFTDKAQESISAALQLAKDYANAQGILSSANAVMHGHTYSDDLL
jgi:hypothetical protein